MFSDADRRSQHTQNVRFADAFRQALDLAKQVRSACERGDELGAIGASDILVRRIEAALSHSADVIPLEPRRLAALPYPLPDGAA